MDKNGNPFTVAAGENGKAVLHANGKVYSDFDSKRVDQYWFDCDVFDCDSPVDAYEANYGRFVRTTKVNLIAEKLILIPIKLTQRLLNILIRYRCHFRQAKGI